MLFGFKNTFGEERVSNPNFLSTQSVEVSTVLISWFFLLGTVAESETLISAQSANQTKLVASTESASASETESAVQKKLSSESESATASNTQTVTLTSFPSVSESTSASSTQSGTQTKTSSVNESASITDSESTNKTQASIDSETATISEMESAIKRQSGIINESVSLIESESSTQKKFTVTTESESIIESSSSTLLIPDSVLETGTITTTQDSDIIITDSVNESASLISIADAVISFHTDAPTVINANKDPYGLIQTPWKTPYVVAKEDLVNEPYILDGKSNVDKYDLILYRNNWIKLQDLQEGRLYTLIFNIVDYSHDASLMPDLPVFLFFHGQDVLWKGLDADYPSIDTNAKITLYKSRDKVYAELSKPYLPSPGGSDS